jgi:hypothetical protein
MKEETFEGYYFLASRNYSSYTKPDKVYYNAGNHKFSFDLNASAGLASDNGNASFSEYLNAKLAAYRRYLR